MLLDFRKSMPCDAEQPIPAFDPEPDDANLSVPLVTTKPDSRVRVNDPQAHGVVRVLGVERERVTLELQLAGLASPADAAVVAALERLGRTAGTPLNE
jgi:hypothetical protein